MTEAFEFGRRPAGAIGACAPGRENDKKVEFGMRNEEG